MGTQYGLLSKFYMVSYPKHEHVLRYKWISEEGNWNKKSYAVGIDVNHCNTVISNAIFTKKSYFSDLTNVLVPRKVLIFGQIELKTFIGFWGKMIGSFKNCAKQLLFSGRHVSNIDLVSIFGSFFVQFRHGNTNQFVLKKVKTVAPLHKVAEMNLKISPSWRFLIEILFTMFLQTSRSGMTVPWLSNSKPVQVYGIVITIRWNWFASSDIPAHN